MKICRVSNSYPHENNPGSGLTPYYLSKYIYQPTLYITKTIAVKKKEVPDHVLLKGISYRDEATPQALRNELHSNEKSNVGQRILRLLKVMTTLRSVVFFLKSIPALIAFKPDIVACHQSMTVFHGVFAKYCLGSKFIFHIHNNSEIVVIKNLWLLKWLVQRADLVFCLTRSMGEELKKTMPSMREKIRHTSTGVNSAFFKDMGMERKKQLIAIGYFRWQKGYLCLLEAVSIVFCKHPDYSLIIIGDGPERETIVERIKTLGISQKVVLKGIVKRQHVERLLNESEMFVMSSIFEGLPKVLLEALACRTPAVVTNGCNADEFIDGKGLVVNKEDPIALANAINRLIEDEKLWKSCHDNARTIIDKYQWQKVAQRVYSDYKGLFSIEYE